MKKVALSLALALLLLMPSLSAGNPFIPTKEGTALEYASLDKNGKVTGYTIQTVKKVTANNRMTTVEIAITVLDKDKKQEKKIPETSMVYKVVDGKVIMDMQFMMEAMLPAEAKTQASITVEGGDQLAYPLGINVGDSLPDANLSVSMTMEGKTMKMSDINTYDRKVLAKEPVTTEAGTFDCYKVTETSETKAMLGMGQTQTSVNWYADGIGSVKSETYDKKGKLVSSSRLLSITRP